MPYTRYSPQKLQYILPARYGPHLLVVLSSLTTSICTENLALCIYHNNPWLRPGDGKYSMAGLEDMRNKTYISFLLLLLGNGGESTGVFIV